MDGKQSQPPAKIFKSEEQERVIELLEERLVRHDENRKAVQDKLHEICEGLRTQINELEDRVNKELEEKFVLEDNRLQAALNELRGNRTANALQKAKAELLVEQSYKVLRRKEKKEFDLTTLYELKAERQIAPELVEVRKPINVRIAGANRGSFSVQFTCLNPDEKRVLSDHNFVNSVKYKCTIFKKDNEQEGKEEYPLDKNEDNDSFTFIPNNLEEETTYGIRTKVVVGNRESERSDDAAEFTTPEFKECCVWRKCPDDVAIWKRKYAVREKDPRVATKNNTYELCAIIGNTHIPLNTVTSWSIKIRKSRDNSGFGIDIGIVPSDTKQSVCDHKKCGWHFECWDSTLCSGPPHNYRNKEYGPRKESSGQYVHTGDSVGVVMDTTRGELSFVLDGVNRGIAYKGIPLDKPLVPCVILWSKGDSVELVI